MTLDEMLTWGCNHFCASYTALRRIRAKSLPSTKYVETIDITRTPTRIKYMINRYSEVKAWKLPLAVIFNSGNMVLFDMKGEKLIVGDDSIITPEGELIFKGFRTGPNLTAYIDNTILYGTDFQMKYPQFCKAVMKDLLPTLAAGDVKITTIRKVDQYRTIGDKPTKIGKEMDKILQEVALQHIENIAFI